MKKVLILCTGNSCRSIMAEALINHFLKGEWQAFSAGTKPSQVNPRTIQVMNEIGVDMTPYYSKSVDLFLNRSDLDLVVTVCDSAKEECPHFPALVKQIHCSFPDPAPFTEDEEKIALAEFRKVREAIRTTLLPILQEMSSKQNLEEKL
ncbi:MAG: arsenate reductase ArsC [bacterium]|nr:arsenate reductase ArsC [bacterium]